MIEPTEGTYLSYLRRTIEDQYEALGGTGCGTSFGELLCHELHTQQRTFIDLAAHWNVSLPTLGDLIADHCRRLEDAPRVGPLRAWEAPEARIREIEGVIPAERIRSDLAAAMTRVMDAKEDGAPP